MAPRLKAGGPGIPLVLIGIGGYLTWFGVHYWRADTAWPSDPVKAVLTGKPIPEVVRSGTDYSQLTTSVLGPGELAGQLGAAAAAGASGRGQQIVAAALAQQGTGYVWGGNASTPGNWDCSSFVSKILGQDLGLPLPGGGKWGDPGYPPNSHGPGSTQYMLYGTGVNHGSELPGDLVVSTEHIGIVIAPGQMISAEDPARGTRTGTYPAGFPAGPPVYRRVTAAGAT